MSWFRSLMLFSILLSIATTISPTRSTELVAQNNPTPGDSRDPHSRTTSQITRTDATTPSKSG